MNPPNAVTCALLRPKDDPLDVTEFFEEEIRAAVKAAEDWGTYVMVHVYLCPGQVQRQAQAESEDFFQLCGRCGYSRYFRAYCHTHNL